MLMSRAEIALAEGEPELANLLASELLGLELEPTEMNPLIAPWVAILLFDLDRADEAPFVPGSSPTPWYEAARLIAQGELEVAADRLAAMSALTLEADVRLRAARQHVARGRRAQANEQLTSALAFYRSVGATRYIREAEGLLAATA